MSEKQRYQLVIRLSREEYTAFAAVAQIANQTPHSFLRQLAQRAIGVDKDSSAAPDGRPPHEGAIAYQSTLAASLTQMEYRIASFENLLSRITDGAADTPTQIQLLDALLRKTLMQAVAGSYVSIQMWRMLADESQRPPNGLPPTMVADIQELARRAATAAEAEARS